MTMFSGSGEPPRTEFVDTDLRGARIVRSDLSGTVMRAVDVTDVDIDSPWLFNGTSTLLVNGIDVVPFVDAELDRRFPGRSLRRAEDPDGLRAAWNAAEATWASTLARVAAMPEGTVDISVDGEWSFAETLRHLAMATDVWLGKAILELEQPFHPLGLPYAEYASDGFDTSIFTADVPTYDEVLTVRAQRVEMVRDFLATATAADLATAKVHPWAPEHTKSTLSCLHVILGEEWEHHRFAVRDLDAIESRRDSAPSP